MEKCYFSAYDDVNVLLSNHQVLKIFNFQIEIK